LIAAAAAAVCAGVVLAPRAQAFPRICSNSICHGSKTDSFGDVDVCYPGSTTYWEDSNLPVAARQPNLLSWKVTPNPPCTGATVSRPTIDPFPASNTDPDGRPAPKEAGKVVYRVRWTVTVPQGSTKIGTMSVAWTVSWREDGAGAKTIPGDTTGDCPTSGDLPRNCRYDLAAKVDAPPGFSAAKTQRIRLTVTVSNGGPKGSPALADGLVFYAHLIDMTPTGKGLRDGLSTTGDPPCQGNFGTTRCAVPGLAPGASRTYHVVLLWNANAKQKYKFIHKSYADDAVGVEFTASVSNSLCSQEETNCKNNADSDESKTH
jgi:hypothetical protein